jgi:transposase
MLINHVRGAVKSSGARLPACNAYMFHRKAADAIPERLGPALSPLLDTIGGLTEQIAAIDKRIETLIKLNYPEAILLQQVPGVGPLIALTFLLSLETRFRRADRSAPTLVVPGKRVGRPIPQLGISSWQRMHSSSWSAGSYMLGYRRC